MLCDTMSSQIANEIVNCFRLEDEFKTFFNQIYHVL